MSKAINKNIEGAMRERAIAAKEHFRCLKWSLLWALTII